jgi:hypothetical protein
MRKLVLIITFAAFIALCPYILAGCGKGQIKPGTPQYSISMARSLMNMMDMDRDGKIAENEYVGSIANADQDKDGFITEQEMMEFSDRHRLGMLPPGRGEGGPDVGQKAPDFSLVTLDGEGKIALSDLIEKGPVVLIFGRYT